MKNVMAKYFRGLSKQVEINIIPTNYRLSTSDSWGSQHGLFCSTEELHGLYTNGLGLSFSSFSFCGRRVYSLST